VDSTNIRLKTVRLKNDTANDENKSDRLRVEK